MIRLILTILTIITIVTMILTGTAFATIPVEIDNVRRFSWAIARAEGFFIKGSLPSRNHNPGDIKMIRGYRFPGQVGTDRHNHVIFRNDNSGWWALQNQIKFMYTGEGAYSPDMTINKVAKIYAKNWKRWSKNVSKSMNCDPGTTLSELFDLPPVIHVFMDGHELKGII